MPLSTAPAMGAWLFPAADADGGLWQRVSGCSGLTSVTIPNSVTSIGSQAFRDCSNLTSVTIPNSVTTIGDHAFYYCSGLTSITIPNSVTTITDYAFYGCRGLTSVTMFNSVTSIGNYAFSGCRSLTSVTIPNSVTSIGDGAFSGCSNLTSVTIPNSVKSIQEHAFYNCSGLTSVTIPNSVKYIHNGAFSGCSGLTSITIPNSVESIAEYAFSGCSSLTSVTIPNSVTSIGISAFGNCSSLTSVTIGNGIKTISKQAFSKCSALEDVYCYSESVPGTGANVFQETYIQYITLHVPANSINAYAEADPWKNFKSIVPIEGTSPENPETKKCAKPTISFVDGELEFSCETEGVEYVSELTVSDAKMYYSSKVSLTGITGIYKVSVYATKAGYENSDVATTELQLPINAGKKGDLNSDGVIDVGDIMTIINLMANSGHK